jgi:hypothetical protein
MFKEKASVLKNIIYLTVLVIHAFLFGYFLSITFLTYIIITLCSLTAVSLITLAFYSFLTTKSYYYYFYIGIIICSFPIIFIVPLSAILVVPELVILVILSAYGLDSGTTYYKMRVNKQANLFQHDPAVTNLLSGTPKALAFRMEEIWNPDSTIQLPNTDVGFKKNNSRVKMQIITFLLTIIYFICSVISVYLTILNF